MIALGDRAELGIHHAERGDPIGIRIQVPRMRIWCPRPLDDGAVYQSLRMVHGKPWLKPCLAQAIF